MTCDNLEKTLEYLETEESLPSENFAQSITSILRSKDLYSFLGNLMLN